MLPLSRKPQPETRWPLPFWRLAFPSSLMTRPFDRSVQPAASSGDPAGRRPHPAPLSPNPESRAKHPIMHRPLPIDREVHPVPTLSTRRACRRIRKLVERVRTAAKCRQTVRKWSRPPGTCRRRSVRRRPRRVGRRGGRTKCRRGRDCRRLAQHIRGSGYAKTLARNPYDSRRKRRSVCQVCWHSDVNKLPSVLRTDLRLVPVGIHDTL